MADFNLNTSRTLDRVKSQVATANTRARSLGLPATLTVDQWLTILNYWHWHCAICDLESSDLSPDHWIPLSIPETTGTVYGNIVALCEGCNLSKGKREPAIWLATRLGDTKASAKLAQVRECFQTLLVPEHPYNTTIPEQAYLGEPAQATSLRTLTLTFDVSLAVEKELWTRYYDDIVGGQFQAYIKNLLYFTVYTPCVPVYSSFPAEDSKP